MEQIPLSEIIVGLVSAVIAWFTSGKFQATTSEIQNAREVLAMWRETSENQKDEIEKLKQDIVNMGTKIFEMEKNMAILEGENQFLKEKLKELNIEN